MQDCQRLAIVSWLRNRFSEVAIITGNIYFLGKKHSATRSFTYKRLFCFWLDSPPVGQSLLIHEVFRSLPITQHSGLLWTSDQLVAETSNWQNKTLTTDKPPCLRWDSNPQCQQARNHWKWLRIWDLRLLQRYCWWWRSSGILKTADNMRCYTSYTYMDTLCVCVREREREREFATSETLEGPAIFPPMV